MLRDQKVRVGAGEEITLAVNADYLRIKKSNIPVRFKTKNGDDFEIKQGDEVSISNFEYVYIKNESAGTEIIDLYTGKNERVGSAELSGEVTIAGGVAIVGTPTVSITSLVPTNSGGLNAQKTVTDASASMMAANANRKYLLIQNKDATGIIYISFGAAATVANGLKIPAGGSFELNCNILTAQIFAIGSIANNPNVVVIEG